MFIVLVFLFLTAASHGLPKPTSSTKGCKDASVLFNGRRFINDDNLYKKDNETWVLLGSKMSFTCDFGYRLRGAKNVLCEKDETWSSTFPVCYNSVIFTTKPGEDKLANGDYLGELTDELSGYGPGAFIQEFASGGRTNYGYQIVMPGAVKETFKCKEKKCESLKSPEGGAWNVRSYSSGEAAYLECSEGYVLRDRKVNNLTCTRVNITELEWSGEMSVCRKLAVCPDPGMPANGTGTRSANEEPYYEGTQFSFECSEGYEMVGRKTILCKNDTSWDFPKPRCKPNITCEDLLVDPHATLTVTPDPRVSDYYVPGDSVELTCHPGYRANTTEGYDTIVCEEDATWDDILFTCQEAFCPPIVVQNGYFLEENPREKYKHGEEVQIRCNLGYRLIGKNWNQCLSGNWQHGSPKCKEITCRDPGSPENGNRFISTPTIRVNSTVTFSCFEGYILTGSSSRVCMSNGEWDGQLSSCTQTGAGGCPNPGEPIDGTRIGNSFGVGETVSFRCNSEFYLYGSANRICQKNGKWSGEEALCRGWLYVDRVQDVKVRLLDQLDTKIALKDSELRAGSAGHMRGRMVDTSIRNTNGLLVLYFVFDSSTSVGEKNFNTSIRFAKALVKRVGISETLNVGVVTYGKISKKDVFPLGAGSDEKQVLDKLSAIKYIGGGTATKPALELVQEMVTGVRNILDARDEKKRKVKSVVFLVTDGIFNIGGNPEEKAKQLRDSMIEIFVIGLVGERKESYQNMERLATSRQHIFKSNNYEAIEYLVDEVLTNKTDYSRCGISVRDYEIMKGRIHNGKTAVLHWPWMAHLKIKTHDNTKKHNVGGCGGSIIDNSWILTAAHCLEKEVHADNITVTVGMLNLTGVDNGERQNKMVDKVVIHEKYANLDYDIALLKLKTPLVYGRFVRRICMPPNFAEIGKGSSFLYEAGQNVTVIGFGKTEENIATTSLKEVEIILQSQDDCKNSVKGYNANVTERMICAGVKEGGKDSCDGDSGGPLMQELTSDSKHQEPYWVQIGIVSWGVPNKCGAVGHFGFYTHLAIFKHWVENTMKQN